LKSNDGTVAFGHQREHLVKGGIEEVVAWLEPKELERGRISTRRHRPTLTRCGRGRKWRAGPELGCSHAEEGVCVGGGVSRQCVAHGRRGVGVRSVANVRARRRHYSVSETGDQRA
jgi:hypothetical protein